VMMKKINLLVYDWKLNVDGADKLVYKDIWDYATIIKGDIDKMEIPENEISLADAILVHELMGVGQINKLPSDKHIIIDTAGYKDESSRRMDRLYNHDFIHVLKERHEIVDFIKKLYCQEPPVKDRRHDCQQSCLFLITIRNTSPHISEG